MTSDPTGLSEAKRALLRKYLEGNAVPEQRRPRSILLNDSNQPAPLSLGQQQLWLLAQLTPEVPVYNECITVGMRGPLDVNLLEESFNESMRRHEAWRTTFSMEDGRPVQVVHASASIELLPIDLRGMPRGQREAEAVKLATQQALIPFDLVTGPLIRTTLVRLDDNEYKLFLAMHHIIFDGFAIHSIFLPELAHLYQSLSRGEPSLLPAQSIRYTDYARWQRETLTQDELKRSLDYWRVRLGGSLPTLELPTDHPRPKLQSHRGGMLWVTLPPSLSGALKELSRAQGVTLFMTLVAAFQTLLYRYAHQEDVLVGTATAGRKRSEFEGIVGYFLNVVVLRTDLSGNPTFAEVLKRVREVTLGAYDHDDAPFEYVVRELQPERDLSQNPIFQAMISLEPPLAPLGPDWTLSQVDIDTGAAKFDLSLELDDREEGIVGRLQYSSDLFEPDTVSRMLDHFKMLLEGIVANPNQNIDHLPLLTQLERRQLLDGHHDTPGDHVEERCIHEMFEEQAVQYPDRVAAVFENASMSYGDLNRRANQLASLLRKSGVGPDVPVGLCVDRSFDLLVGILGILKAGGAYVPLDPIYPPDRLGLMIRDTAPPVVVSQERFAESLPLPPGSRLLCLDQDRDAIAAESSDALECTLRPHNIAYIMYTSGSTGSPKGVLVTHANVVRLFTSTNAWFRFNCHDVWTLVHSYAFDFSVWEMWGALLYGGRLVIVPRAVSRSPETLYQVLERERVTVLNQTPKAFAQLIPVDVDARGAGTSALRLVIFGGEALDFQSLRPWIHIHGDQRPVLINMYGITETTVHVTYYHVTARDVEGSGGSIIGAPIPDLRIYILNQAQQLMPIGATGEIYVGGAGVARGYFNLPDLTADRFVPDPFRPGERLYRSGDIGRVMSTGQIEYKGRIDDQVKVRGFRVELGEIEAILMQHPGLSTSAVVVRNDGRKETLVAYVVARGSQVPAVTTLRSFLAQKLPDYMIPGAYVFLPALPLSENGKVDRASLPAVDRERPALATNFIPARTRAERAISDIWSDMLDVERVGVHDSFFDLGGDSLLATQVVSRLASVLGVRLPMRVVFEQPSVAGLAAALEEYAGRGRNDEGTIQARPRRVVKPNAEKSHR
ncbi:MAG: non-ribosomal peptide synthetase [Chloroflexota bacterium]